MAKESVTLADWARWEENDRARYREIRGECTPITIKEIDFSTLPRTRVFYERGRCREDTVEFFRRKKHPGRPPSRAKEEAACLRTGIHVVDGPSDTLNTILRFAVRVKPR